MRGSHLETEHRRLKAEHKRLCAAVVAKEEHYRELDEENHRLRDATPRDVLAAHDNLERLRSAKGANGVLIAEMEQMQKDFEQHSRETTAELLANLRDKFAMAGINFRLQEPGAIARRAYAIADAMLEARKT